METTLTIRQQHLVTMTVYVTLGNLGKLKQALSSALNDGLTINEAKETMLHLIAYAGFPRGINGTITLMEVVDKRISEGIIDSEGQSSTALANSINKNEYGEKMRTELTGTRPTPAYASFSPALDDFLKEYLFADLFSRETLSKLDRELITISVLASLKNVPNQLQTHITITQNLGLSQEQLENFKQITSEILELDSIL